MVSVARSSGSVAVHVPVLLQEVIEGLQPHPGGWYIDATVGAGGHAAQIMSAAGPGARLLGLDADPSALAIAARALEPFGDAVILEETNFRHIKSVAEDLGFFMVSGILLDLGVSSMQVATPSRGFSFSSGDPLDMRFSPHQRVSAGDIVNTCPEQALADLLFRYGEEPASRLIAHRVVASRPVHTSAQLAAIVAQAVGRRGGRTHPATRTFQALRMAVNDELGALQQALPQAVSLLERGGRLAVISFHSLEDRIVKNFFQTESRDCLCPPRTPVCICGHVSQLRLITRRALRPSPDEIARNPRSRSAVLRIAEKL